MMLNSSVFTGTLITIVSGMDTGRSLAFVTTNVTSTGSDTKSPLSTALSWKVNSLSPDS